MWGVLDFVADAFATYELDLPLAHRPAFLPNLTSTQAHSQNNNVVVGGRK